ncbi:MAG: FAD-dependent oxidoreductase, partial [Spirochaetia bacterium]|nr:FAD-dependent oxidoreductase [Spirochaetia bacterium]
LHLRKPGTRDFIKKLMPGTMLEIGRKAYIYSHGTYTGYPYQVNNYGLPASVVSENIDGFLKAKAKGPASQKNFREWILTALGTGIAKNFMFPYNSKLFRIPLDRMTVAWMGRFVPSPSIDEVMRGLMPKGENDMGYNARFSYPEKGGIETVIMAVYEPVKDAVQLNAPVKSIDTAAKIVHYGNGKSVQYENLISTMPLRLFASLTRDRELKSLAAKLKAVSVYSLNIGFRKRRDIGKHWVYVPEPKYPFYRIGFPSEVSEYNAPKGCSSVFTEVSFTDRVPAGIDSKIISGLMDMGIVENRNDIIVKYPMVLRDAYVLYDLNREAVVSEMQARLEKMGIITAGRWGRWEYSSMEDAMLEGFAAAEKVK